MIIYCIFFIIIFKPQNKKTRKFTLSLLPPGPKPWPIVGNIPEMLAYKSTFFRWIHSFMKEMNTEIACFRLGNVHVIPVTCPEIAREFLRKQDAAFASRPISMSTEVITRGYLTTALVPFGEQWKKMKRIVSHELLSPTKHQRFHFLAKRTQAADNLVFRAYRECNENNDGVVNVRDVARQYCCSVIKKLCFNMTSFGNGSRNEEVEHIEAIFTLLKYIYAFRVSDYVPWLRGLDLDGHEAKVKDALGILNRYHDPIIEMRIQEYWNNNDQLIRSKIDGDEDFLDILISLKDANNKPILTLQEIKAQIIVSNSNIVVLIYDIYLF
jgi:hypothetical protein